METMEKTKTIVIVDDNKDYLFTMETFLSRNGFAVFTAEDGEKGLALIKEKRPDCVLLDIMMESLFSGFDVCKAIKGDPDFRDIPIIGVSGISEELGVRPEQYKDDEYFNPDAFIEKPVDNARLLESISSLIQKARERKNRPRWKKALDSIREQDQ